MNNIKTEFDILKSALITQYTNNILDDMKNFGNEYADRLFPKSRVSGTGKTDPQNNVNNKAKDNLILTAV